MKLKNKILIILILLAGFIILTSSSCFAVDSSELINKSDYKINITFEHFDIDFDSLNYKAILFDPISDYNFLYVSDGNFTIRDKNEDDILFNSKYNSSIILELSNENTVVHKFTLRSDCFSIDDENKTIYVSKNYGATSPDIASIRNDNNLLEVPIFRNGTYSPDYSTINTSDFIYVGNAVFCQPPQATTTLAPIVEEVETEKTLAQVVAILPIVLVVIVGLIALRKAIKFLKTLLT